MRDTYEGNQSIELWDKSWHPPVNEVVDEVRDICNTEVHLVEVVGVLPDVNHEEGVQPVGDGHVRVARLDDAELAGVVLAQPHPAAAKQGVGARGELRLWGFSASVIVIMYISVCIWLACVWIRCGVRGCGLLFASF